MCFLQFYRGEHVVVYLLAWFWTLTWVVCWEYAKLYVIAPLWAAIVVKEAYFYICLPALIVLTWSFTRVIDPTLHYAGLGLNVG